MSKSAKFANIVLGSVSLLFLLLFFHILWKSNFHPSGHMNKYVISMAGFLFYSFVFIKCSIDLKVKIALLTLSLIFSIYAIEMFFSYSFKSERLKQNRANIADYLGITFDSRAVIQVASDMRNTGVTAYPLYNPISNMELKKNELLPLGYISDKTTVFCNESGEFIVYTSDEHGFNNPKGLYDIQALDYLLIGDSFTQGACVKPEENIAGRLMKSDKKTLNLGILNSGPLNQLAILKEYGKPLQPKTVLWFFYEGNDHEGLAFDKNLPFLMKYLARDFTQDLIHKQKAVDYILSENVNELLNEFMEFRHSLAEKTEGTETNNKDASLNMTSSIIKLSQLRRRLTSLEKCEYKTDPLLKDVFVEVKSIVDGWGGQLYFIYLPAWERYPDKANHCRKQFLDTGKKYVLTVINELKIPIIDIQSVFDSHPDPLSLFPLRIKGHYNAKGYKLVAEYLEKHIPDDLEED